jgi:hypothetical protein
MKTLKSVAIAMLIAASPVVITRDGLPTWAVAFAGHGSGVLK